MISFNGFPFLNTKEEHTFHTSVSSVMTPSAQLALLPSSGLSLRALETLLRKTSFQGFPVVEDRAYRILLGYIGRSELRYAIDKTKKDQALELSPDAKCLFFAPASTAARTPSVFTPPVIFDQIADRKGMQTIDFSRFVDPTPLAVHPKLALETVMELFKKMGPSVVLVELKGRLMGLVTVKDCLKYQFKVEAQERGGEGDGRVDRLEVWLWGTIQGVADWVGGRVHMASRGRIRLGRGEVGGEPLLSVGTDDPRDERVSIGSSVRMGRQERRILDGTENEDEGLGLQDR